VSDDRFEVINSQLKLKAGVSLNFEDEPTVDLTVTSTDTGGLSKQQVFTLNATNVNDVAPVFSSGGTGSVMENAATSTVIYQAAATDADGSTFGAVTYTLSGTDADLLTISSTGAVTLKNSADYEAKSSYSFNVVAAQGSGPSTPQPVTVSVTDEKEDTAVFNFKLTDAAISFAGSDVVIDGPSGQHFVLSGFNQFQFTDGTVDERGGNASVSDLFYYAHNLDVWNARIDADAHYAAFGWQEGRDPNAFFSTNGYLSANQDVDLANNNPLEHYHQSGWREGRDASVSFDTTLYLLNNADVKAAGVDPLEHYLANGRFEGRQAYTAVGQNVQGTFDAEYYLLTNPDVGLADVDAAFHFQTYGWQEGRDPNAFFDTSAYLAAYGDVAAAGVNPLEHYNSFGWKEGRDPSGAFDSSSYLQAYADVAAAGVNPLEHYLKYGIYEGRSSFGDSLIG
jgi:hypothetical protein